MEYPYDYDLSQSLSIRAMSFDLFDKVNQKPAVVSQSLSIRAMSFDTMSKNILPLNLSLNPFRAGRCLSTIKIRLNHWAVIGLNPFRAGRCLSTYHGNYR